MKEISLMMRSHLCWKCSRRKAKKLRDSMVCYHYYLSKATSKHHSRHFLKVSKIGVCYWYWELIRGTQFSPCTLLSAIFWNITILIAFFVDEWKSMSQKLSEAMKASYEAQVIAEQIHTSIHTFIHSYIYLFVNSGHAKAALEID